MSTAGDGTGRRKYTEPQLSDDDDTVRWSIQSTAVKVQRGTQNLHKSLLNAKQIMVLNQLHIAQGAFFDSYAQEHNRYCSPNTRVKLLQQIAKWAKNIIAEPIFWLNGRAGTGKSTISRTVAKTFAENGQLGASFFFKKGETDRSSLSKFFMTIAADLVVKKPATARYIEAALNCDSSITTANATDQFQKLLLEPLSKIDIERGPVVIVVDALDECEQEDGINRLLYLVSRLETELPDRVRIFMTSRPEEPFRSQFEKIKRINSRVILCEITQPMVQHDMDVFLRYELSRIRAKFNNQVTTKQNLTLDWPGQSSFDRLMKMAFPHFLVAATICRFIGDEKIGIPRKLLERVLSQPNYGVSQLEIVYRSVLDNLIAEVSVSQQEQIIQEFHQVVGSIILLASPLSTSSLAKLLSISKDDIDSRLDLLHSVLRIPSAEAPVSLLHISFRDFLLYPEEPAMPFRVDWKQTHANLAAHCLRVLNCLKKDLCDIKSPGTPRSDISSEVIDRCLSPEVQYSCQYWVYHFKEAGITLSEGTDAYDFLRNHFLYWIEALALIGRASESLRLLSTLRSQCKGKSNVNISMFLEDAIRFVQKYMPTISSTPLQLYSSLLIFAPKQSKIRTMFENSDDIARWICVKPQVEEYWNDCLQTLEGHYRWVTSVAFSHDSTLVASGSGDETIRIWRADIGECVQTLAGHSQPVTSVVFSHDSTLVASGSGEMVRIWRAVTGECVQILKGHGHKVTSVAFSHDSTFLASGSYKTVRIWRVDTGECVQTLKGQNQSITSNTGRNVQILTGHSQSITTVVFSHDSALLASGSDRTVRIWRADTGECVQTLLGHSQFVTSIALSHDSTLLASGSDKMVRIWRVDTGECVQTLKGHHHKVTSVVFSHDSTLVASGSDSATARIWRSDTGECVQTLGHEGRVATVVFSHDSTLLASGSSDTTARIWRVNIGERANIGEPVQRLAVLGRSVTSVVFSHNSTLIATGSKDSAVRIWRADTGKCVQTLVGHGFWVTSVVFSHDSTLVASGSYDKTVRIWRADIGDCMQKLVGHNFWVKCVVFSHDSTLIASGSDDKTVRIWRADIGECIQTLAGHGLSVRSVVFSHDSTLVASGSDDKTVRIWRADTGECMQMLAGHSLLVRSVVFSHDSKLIASGSDDETVRIWRADTGECIQTLDIGLASRRLIFDRNSSYIITDVGAIAINDGTLEVAQLSMECFNYRKDQTWITCGGRKLLWLPVEFQPSCSSVSGTTIVIGCVWGEVIIVGLSPDCSIACG